MLDTIKIKIKHLQIVRQIKVWDVYGNNYLVDAFKYPEMELKEKRFIKASEYIEKTGSYYPSVSFRSNGDVFIEFSAPKILFDNNVEELVDEDKEAFIKQLAMKLYDLGLNVSNNTLLDADISFATVSKNVFIHDVGATEFIEFTRRLWWKWRYSLKFENYEQNGVAIRKFTSTTGVGIYAKIPSLASIKTKTHREMQLAQELQGNSLLRFEYRMQNYQRTMSKYSWAKGYKLSKLTLEDIFNIYLSKKIMLYDLEKSLLGNEFKLITMQLPNIKRMYEHLQDKGLKPNEELTVIACFRLCSDLGVDTAKALFDNRYSQSTTKRVFKLCKQVFEDFEEYDYQKVRNSIEDSLSSFVAIRGIELDKMLSHKSGKQDQIKLI